MSAEKPDYHDAKLVLMVYDLRREAVMRASRDLINRNFWPRTYDEFIAVTRLEHPMNAAFRQVSSFWEMVFGMAKNGIVNADYFAESNTEGFFVFAKVLPHLERFRSEGSPMAFANVEWMVNNSAAAKRRFAMVRERVEKMLAAPPPAAPAAAKKKAKPSKAAKPAKKKAGKRR